jgi:hypothetical protein
MDCSEDSDNEFTGCALEDEDEEYDDYDDAGITHCCMRCGGVVATDTMYVDDTGFPVSTSVVSKQAKLEDAKRKAEASQKRRADNKPKAEIAKEKYAADKKKAKEAADKQANYLDDRDSKFAAKNKKAMEKYKSDLQRKGPSQMAAEEALENSAKKAKAALAAVSNFKLMGGKKKKK